MVHNGVMSAANKTVRQSVSLPATTAAKVRSLAKTRRVSSNRMLRELIENGIEAEKRKQQKFFDLAERFRAATDPEEVSRLGDQMGRMIFGADAQDREMGQSACLRSPALDRQSARPGDRRRGP